MSCPAGRKRQLLQDGLWWSTVAFYCAVTTETLVFHARGAKGPLAAVLALAAIAALIALRAFERRGAAGPAFSASTAFVVALLGAAVVTICPYIIPAIAGGAGISIFAAASPSSALLGIIAIAVAGLAIVTAYSIAVARRFAVNASEE